MLNPSIYWILIVPILFGASISDAQQIRINELMTVNTQFLDEDGDATDWFELFNPSNAVISIEGWTLTDDKDIPDQWTFPAYSLAPESYLNIWASDKDKKSSFTPRTLITQGDAFSYLIPTAAMNEQWTTLNFDDSSWNNGVSGFGFGDDDDATIVPQGTNSIYLRRKFLVTDTDEVSQLILDIDYDDAFVAYLNGVEVARANIIGTPPAFNAFSITDREALMHTNGSPQSFDLTSDLNLLVSGENVLSIQLHNHTAVSTDLSIIPFLTAFYNSSSTDGIEPPALLNYVKNSFHTNFKLSDEEVLYLFDANGTLIDSLETNQIPTDASFGYSSNSNELVYFLAPTPGAQNSAVEYSGVSEASVEFSHPGGKSFVFDLSLSSVANNAVIRYTLDATDPTETSTIYTTPISISENTVVRTRVFENGKIPSTVQSKTYLVNVQHELPIISLVTEPDNFFDSDTGIYVLGDGYTGQFPYFNSNIWEDWERPINFTFYEPDGSLGINFDGGVKIFGGWSRGNEQRSLSIFARNKYGVDEIDYPLFPDLEYDQFQSIILRNSGNDWLNTMMRDATLTGLLDGADLEYQAYRPAVTYINGEYWGFYNMREKISEHFLASKFDIETEDIDILEIQASTIHGSNEDYLDLIAFINSNALDIEDNYKHVAEQVDIDNFILYNLAQIYFDNQDWPGNNIKYWKEKDGKWRWILFDTDFGFGTWNDNNYQNNTLEFALEPNGPAWPNPSWSTNLLRKLMANIGFRNKFINQFADELNSRFLPLNVSAAVDDKVNGIKSEINKHYQRWGGFTGYWNSQVENLKKFGNLRPNTIKSNIASTFSLPGIAKVTLENKEVNQGFININSLTIQESLWQGDYFRGVPISVTAIPEPGYAFSHWSGDNNSTDPILQINLSGPITLIPIWTTTDQAIVINEINYNSPDDFDTGDWIELFNASEDNADLSNWVIKDNDDSHSFIFPAGTNLPGKSYLVITKNLSNFKSLNPDVNNVLGDMDFGLGSQEDAVRIFTPEMKLIDEVHYSSVSPWPTEANGQGPSLELERENLDNALPQSWKVLHEYGSPGIQNYEDIITDPGDSSFALSIHPNPFIDEVNLFYRLENNADVRINLFDSKGALILELFEGNQDAGEYFITENFNFLVKGIYLLEFREGENRQTLKWIKI